MYKIFRPFNKPQQIINTRRGKKCININKLTWYIIDVGRTSFRISTTIEETCLQILFIDLTSPEVDIATNTK